MNVRTCDARHMEVFVYFAHFEPKYRGYKK